MSRLLKKIVRGGLTAFVLLFGVRNALALPKIGDTAPDFSLSSQEGKAVSLSDYRGHWVVLYFYPKDFTSGCTLEAHNFQRDSSQYADRGAVILGVSMDDAKSHGEFCTKENLSFKLLADTAGTVSETYESTMNILGKKLSKRNTFLIDPKGKIARVFVSVKPGEHSEEVLAALDALQASIPKPSTGAAKVPGAAGPDEAASCP